MRLDRRFFLVIGFSLVWALVVSLIFYRVAGRARKRAYSGPEQTLVVAARPLPLGATIQADSVKTTRVPSALFPRGGFSRLEDVLERPVISPIESDEAVVEARIAARGTGIGLAPMIPSGMRAISVKVNEVVGVAGFVLPGMRVDVLVTGRPPGRQDTITATVLQNITVLSAGQTIQADPKNQSINAPVVTLLVTPAQAEALTLANNEGRIQLVLRNSGDQQVARTPGRELRDIYGLERLNAAIQPDTAPARPKRTQPVTPAAPAAAVSPPVAPPDEVVIIRGNRKTVEPVTPKTAPI